MYNMDLLVVGEYIFNIYVKKDLNVVYVYLFLIIFVGK